MAKIPVGRESAEWEQNKAVPSSTGDDLNAPSLSNEPTGLHHTEIFDVPDKTQPPEHEYHHRTDRSRYLTDPEQAWDGDKYMYDPRCEKCRSSLQSSDKK